MVESKKKPGWVKELNSMIDVASHSPFKRGNHDCCLWVAETIYKMTDEDISICDKGDYDSLTDGLRIIKKEFGEDADIEKAFEIKMKEHGFEELENTDMAQRGDLVLIETTENISPAICIGPDAITVSTKGGTTKQPLKDFIRAWRV